MIYYRTTNKRFSFGLSFQVPGHLFHLSPRLSGRIPFVLATAAIPQQMTGVCFHLIGAHPLQSPYPWTFMIHPCTL